MKKYLKNFALFLLSLLVFWAINRYQKNNASIIPYPYTTNKVNSPNFNAPIAIIGDQMGVNLYRYKKSLVQKLSVNLNKDIEINNLANKNENLHRTTAKLQKLNSWPKLLIYQGASYESYEQRFIKSQISKIDKNFKKYKNDWFKTLVMFFKSSSRLIYTPVKYYEMKEKITPDKTDYKNSELLKRNELIFKLYEFELTDLILQSKEKGSELILLTSPINFTIPPLKSCAQIKIPGAPRLSEIKNQYQNKDFKSAFNLAEQRANLLLADAESYFWRGKTLLKLGERKKALASFKLANAYDCSLKRANMVFNSIMIKLAKQYQVPLFDFNQYLHTYWGKNSLFFDQETPQDLYMENLTGFLANKIKLILNI